jgi:sugar phosphate isomerase/epimerase
MTETKRLISLDRATTPGLNPRDLIALADELSCDAVVVRLSVFPAYDDDPWDIVSDASLRRKIREEIAARGMFVALGSGFEINAGVPFASLQRPLEALSGVSRLDYTVDLIQRINHPALGISEDSLHITRTGATTAQLAAVPEGRIGHAQVNDGPAYLPVERQMEEASGERMSPGDGESDLFGFVRALPLDVPIGVEAGTEVPVRIRRDHAGARTAGHRGAETCDRGGLAV